MRHIGEQHVIPIAIDAVAREDHAIRPGRHDAGGAAIAGDPRSDVGDPPRNVHRSARHSDRRGNYILRRQIAVWRERDVEIGVADSDVVRFEDEFRHIAGRVGLHKHEVPSGQTQGQIYAGLRSVIAPDGQRTEARR